MGLHRLSARRQDQENQKQEEKTTFTLAFFGVLFVCSLFDVGITGKHLLIETEDTTEAGQAGSNDYGYLGGYIPYHPIPTEEKKRREEEEEGYGMRREEKKRREEEEEGKRRREEKKKKREEGKRRREEKKRRRRRTEKS